MSASGGTASPTGHGGVPLGALGALGSVLGFVTIVEVTAIGLISFTAFNPPEWVRLGVLALFAVCWLSSIVLDVLGLRSDRRTAALVGLGFCTASAVALLIMISIAG